MGKTLFVKCDLYDFGATNFENSKYTVEEIIELVKKGEESFNKGEFSAEIIDFESHITENDIKVINSRFLDTHHEKLYYITKWNRRKGTVQIFEGSISQPLDVQD